MSAPDRIAQLVEVFDRNADAYRSDAYNEAQCRIEFINPFFECLGWDINNTRGASEKYKDVIHEAAVKIGDATKAPDYLFRFGGNPVFFLEAKKPAVNLHDDPAPAYQLRRYAWTAKLPLSILTNFEEFAVYDCRKKPAHTDKASAARIRYDTFGEYADKWSDIAGIFSKGAVEQGSFDKYADTAKGKRGTATVDTAFLQEIEDWREMLAKELALRNPELTQRELNYAVQVTIDRIIFLRMCEDRGIEKYGQLMTLLNGTAVYGRLKELFQSADDRYNSGLFHFHKERDRPEQPDTLTPTLAIEDKPLKQIIHSLYYPDSPYAFAVMPAEILGQVYEQFLGKVIRLTAGHKAKVEEKPEVKKAGGVYYTPAYIVDYIVKHTVGKLLGEPGASATGEKPGLTPKQASKLRILDPACGSGSFLLGAYQCLLDWHRERYVVDGPENHDKELYQDRAGAWQLTTAEKKRILLNNIYGVDIDPQAVEVTKLSLLLKVLEGESNETLERQRSLWHQRALPDLDSNIKCGNSLIGPDFYEEQQLTMFDEAERYRINVFDWNDGFPQVMKAGGFNAVIGNPPYIFTRELLSEPERSYFSARYKASWEKHNTFMLFMELMLRLLKAEGRGGFIVPNSWLTIESGKLLRALFIPRLLLVADLNYQVFNRVSMEPCIFAASGTEMTCPVLATRIDSMEAFLETTMMHVARERWSGDNGRIVFSQGGADVEPVIDRVVANSRFVGDVFDVRTGLQAYEKGKGTPPQSKADVQNHVFDRQRREDEDSIRYLEGKDVGRYCLAWSGMWMQYGPWLSQPRELGIFCRPRILVREITGDYPRCLHSMFVSDKYLNNKSVLNILHISDNTDDLMVLLCVMNSRLMSLFYKERAVKSSRKIFPKVVIKNLREFPYPSEFALDKRNKAVHLANQIVTLHQHFAKSKTPHDKAALQSQIAATDRQIDQLVYELYGLTAEEIAIVERSGAQ